jgi:hypothetical protein
VNAAGLKKTQLQKLIGMRIIFFNLEMLQYSFALLCLLEGKEIKSHQKIRHLDNSSLADADARVFLQLPGDLPGPHPSSQST